MDQTPAQPEQASPAPPSRRDVLLRRLYTAGVAMVILMLALRFVHLDADFPIEQESRFARDGVLFSDEGWYANNAIAFMRHDSWYNAHDMNFALALPVNQLVHVVFFSLLGVTIEAARLSSVLPFIGVVGLVWALVRRFHGKWPALLAAWVLSSNYFLFAYSRFAISEMLMLLLVFLGLWMASRASGPRAWAWTFGAAAASLLALLTKTTALPGAALVVLVLLAVGWKEKGRWARPIVAGLLFGVPWLAHKIVIARLYPEDIAFFQTINVGMHLETNAWVWLETVGRTFRRIRDVDKITHYVFRFGLVPLILLLPTARRSPVLLGSLLFIVGYAAMFGFYRNIQPRYWVPYLPFVAMIMAVSVKALWDARGRHKLLRHAWAVLLAAFMVASGAQVVEVVKCQLEPRFTFRDAARDIDRIIRAETDEERPVVLGHISHSFSLYIDIHPVNDLYAPAPLVKRLDHYQPRWLITEDTVEVQRPWIVQEAVMKDPRDSVQRYKDLTARYKIEHLAEYSILDEYDDYPVHFYRLVPLEEAAEEP